MLKVGQIILLNYFKFKKSVPFLTLGKTRHFVASLALTEVALTTGATAWTLFLTRAINDTLVQLDTALDNT